MSRDSVKKYMVDKGRWMALMTRLIEKDRKSWGRRRDQSESAEGEEDGLTADEEPASASAEPPSNSSNHEGQTMRPYSPKRNFRRSE